MPYFPTIGFPYFGGLSLIEEAEEEPTVSGLIPLPGINARYHLPLIQGNDYIGSRALYFPAQSGEVYPTLDGEIAVTLSVDGVATEIAGEVATVDEEDIPMVEIEADDIPLAGTGIFDVQHTAVDGTVTTLVLGDVNIQRRAWTEPEEEP